MTRRKPLLFLDVDGVLNVFGADFERQMIELPGERFPHYLYPTSNTKSFLRWAWSVFDVYWCTAWGPDANVIATWARLPKKPCAANVRSSSMEWKLDGVKEIRNDSNRKAVWIEDGIGKVAEEWVSVQENFFYVHTDYRVGVTKTHACFLADILHLPMEAWRGARSRNG